MCYEMASGCSITKNTFECGPTRTGSSLSEIRNESHNIQQNLYSVIPQLSEETTIFHPTWVRRNSIMYKNNNAYVVVRSDGLDPVFGRIDDILVTGGNMVVFYLCLCKTEYFDHFHAYVISDIQDFVSFSFG